MFGEIATWLVKGFIVWQVLITICYLLHKDWTTAMYWFGAILLTTAVLIKS